MYQLEQKHLSVDNVGAQLRKTTLQNVKDAEAIDDVLWDREQLARAFFNTK